jgi:hypothetical protein
MKKVLLLALLAMCSIGATQIPETGDSIYYSPKFCDTSESIEDALDSWTWNGNTEDCINPPEGMLNALWPGLVIYDSYDCCCKVASTPGMPGAWTGFEGSPCEEYLDGIGFTSIDENHIDLDGLYIDMYGVQHIQPPKGLSVKNKIKYLRL